MTGRTKVLVFQNRFLLGGQERQTVLNVLTMDRARWEPVVACLKADGELIAPLAAVGIRPIAFDVGGSMASPRAALALAQLVHFIRQTGIAVVHAQDFYTNTLGTLAATSSRAPAACSRPPSGSGPPA